VRRTEGPSYGRRAYILRNLGCESGCRSAWVAVTLVLDGVLAMALFALGVLSVPCIRMSTPTDPITFASLRASQSWR